MQYTWDGPLYISRSHWLLFLNEIVIPSLEIFLKPEEVSRNSSFFLVLHCLQYNTHLGVTSLCILMDFPIQIDTFRMGLSIVYLISKFR